MHNDPKKQSHYVEGMMLAHANKQQIAFIEGKAITSQVTPARTETGLVNLTNLTQRYDAK